MGDRDAVDALFVALTRLLPQHDIAVLAGRLSGYAGRGNDGKPSFYDDPRNGRARGGYHDHGAHRNVGPRHEWADGFGGNRHPHHEHRPHSHRHEDGDGSDANGWMRHDGRGRGRGRGRGHGFTSGVFRDGEYRDPHGDFPRRRGGFRGGRGDGEFHRRDRDEGAEHVHGHTEAEVRDKAPQEIGEPNSDEGQRGRGGRGFRGRGPRNQRRPMKD